MIWSGGCRRTRSGNRRTDSSGRRASRPVSFAFNVSCLLWTAATPAAIDLGADPPDRTRKDASSHCLDTDVSDIELALEMPAQQRQRPADGEIDRGDRAE